MQAWIRAHPDAALSRICNRGRWDSMTLRGREAIGGFFLTGDPDAVRLWPPGPVEYGLEFDAHPAVVMRADPVNLSPGADQLILNQIRFPDLMPEDAAALVETIDHSVATTGTGLHSGRSGHWYLTLGEAPDGRWWSPAEVEGRHVLEFMPRGPGCARLNALITEIQMLLHDHPINLRRAEEGLLAINSVWPWGWTRQPAMSTSPGLQARLLSTDVYTKGLEQLATAPAAADADELAVVASMPGEDSGDFFARLEREWAASLFEDLRRGRISGAKIAVTDGDCVTISRLDLLKFWRRGARS